MGRRTEDKEAPAPRDSPPKVDADENIGRLAMSFFQACTKVSDSDEDILPQEDSEDMRMSVFAAFAELFPESIGDDGHAGERYLTQMSKLGPPATTKTPISRSMREPPREILDLGTTVSLGYTRGPQEMQFAKSCP